MALTYNRREIAQGVFLTQIYDEKFKPNNITVKFITSPDEKKLAANILVPTMLITSNSRIRSRTELSKKLMGLYGTSLSSTWNTLGDHQSVGFSTSPIGDKYTIGGEKISTEVVGVLLDCIFSPDITDGRFNEKYFELRKQELIDNISAMVNNKRSYAYTRAKELAFAGESSGVTELAARPYAEKLTHEQVIDRYRYLLKSAVIEITVCGGGEIDEAVEMLTQAFSKLERENVEQIVYRRNSPVKDAPAYAEELMSVKQSKMFMSYKSDYEDIYVCKLFAMMLGNTPFSKLYLNVREKMSLCYYCSALYLDMKGTLMIDSGVETADLERAKAAIQEQLSALARGEFTDEELENTKLYLCGSFRSNYDSEWDTAGWYAAQNTRGTCYSPDEVGEIIRSISREQIIECASSFRADSVFVLKANGEAEDE